MLKNGIESKSLLDRAGPWAVSLVLAAFFYYGLVYPLGTSLWGGLHEPDRIERLKDKETLAQFAERRKLNLDELRKLNQLAPDQEPKDGKVLTAQGYATLKHVKGLFAEGAPQAYWIFNSLLLALAVTLICVAISYPLAYWQSRFKFPGQMVLAGLLLLPLIVPPFVGAIGLRRLLSKYGAFNQILIGMGVVDEANPIDFLGGYRWIGCVVVMVLHFYPLIYLNLAASISSIDPALLESARNLGMTPWQVFRRVTFPLTIPGLIAGASLVFIGAFTDLGTPLVFGYQEVVAQRIFSLSNEQASNPAAPALVGVVTVIVVALFFGSRWLLSRLGGGGSAGSMGLGAGVKGSSRGAAKPLTGVGVWICIAFHLVVIGMAILPHLSIFFAGLADRWVDSVFPQSYTLSHLQEAMEHRATQAGVRNSLFYATISTAIDVVLGLACAWVMVRRGGVWGKVVDALVLIPLAVPGLVLAFGYLGAYGDKFLNEPVTIPVGIFLILSYAIRRLPYTARACAAGLEQTPKMLEEAAGGLGYSPARVIARVTVPLIMAQVAAGAILAFAFAMLEVSDSLILAQRSGDYPLTKAIYALFGRVGDGDQLASALGLFALFFMAFALLAASSFLGRKWGEAFGK